MHRACSAQLAVTRPWNEFAIHILIPPATKFLVVWWDTATSIISRIHFFYNANLWRTAAIKLVPHTCGAQHLWNLWRTTVAHTVDQILWGTNVAHTCGALYQKWLRSVTRSLFAVKKTWFAWTAQARLSTVVLTVLRSNLSASCFSICRTCPDWLRSTAGRNTGTGSGWQTFRRVRSTGAENFPRRLFYAVFRGQSHVPVWVKRGKCLNPVASMRKLFIGRHADCGPVYVLVACCFRQNRMCLC